MINQSTIDKLIEMRLTSMADAFRIQLDDTNMKDVPFEDRFGMLVDIEYTNRKNNRLKRLIKRAELEQPDASIAAIDYTSGRKLIKVTKRWLCWSGQVAHATPDWRLRRTVIFRMAMKRMTLMAAWTGTLWKKW